MNAFKRSLSFRINSDRMFSYVYVKDVVKIIHEIVSGSTLQPSYRLIRLVAYTDFFSGFLDALISVLLPKGSRVPSYFDIRYDGSENFCNSYVGKNNYSYQYTPLEKALKDMWGDLHDKKDKPSSKTEAR